MRAGIEEINTHLRWEGGVAQCTGPGGTFEVADPHNPTAPSRAWNPVSLLLAAVDAELMHALIERAAALDIPVLYYESSTMGRLAPDALGNRHLLDVIIRPRIGTVRLEDARRLRELLDGLSHVLPTHASLHPLPRIEPIIEAWPEQVSSFSG